MTNACRDPTHYRWYLGTWKLKCSSVSRVLLSALEVCGRWQVQQGVQCGWPVTQLNSSSGTLEVLFCFNFLTC